MQTIKPSKDQLFCKPDEVQEVTKSGLYINKNTVDKPKTAKVINIGSDVKGYSANDVIVYKAYAPTDIKVNNEDFILVAEEDVLGKIIEVDA
jgi:chaperonin GroES